MITFKNCIDTCNEKLVYYINIFLYESICNVTPTFSINWLFNGLQISYLMFLYKINIWQHTEGKMFEKRFIRIAVIFNV